MQHQTPRSGRGCPRAGRFRPSLSRSAASAILLFAAAFPFAAAGHTTHAASSSESSASCIGDLDGDGTTDVFDLLILLSQWGECAKAQPCYDLTGDEAVGVFDLLALLGDWGCIDSKPACCEGFFCGTSAIPPCGCWCDEMCFIYDDCCHDVCTCDYPQCRNSPESTGACCFATNCQNLTAAECSEQFGHYAGDDTDCFVDHGICPMDLWCAGHCGEQSLAECWCDESCFTFGDCCDTICTTCPHLENCQEG